MYICNSILYHICLFIFARTRCDFLYRYIIDIYLSNDFGLSQHDQISPLNSISCITPKKNTILSVIIDLYFGWVTESIVESKRIVVVYWEVATRRIVVELGALLFLIII